MNREAGPKFRFTKSNVIVFVLSGLLIIAIIFLACLVLNKQISQEDVSDADISFETSYNESLEASIIKKENEIESETNVQRKSYLILNKVALLYDKLTIVGEDNLSIIKDNIYTAEETYPTAQTAWSIYNYEKQYGDKEVAEEYYQIFEQRSAEEESTWEAQLGEG